MKSNITQLIDFSKIDVLLESFNKSTGFVTAILDLEGNILSKSGWRNVCVEFHRKNTATSHNCLISDTVLANKMADGEKYHFYKCMNGLVDVAMPIMLNGEHVANLFTGQFFVEEPDIEFFSKQAQKYGFDEEKYLNYLSKVPVVSEEKVKANLDFLHLMTQFISERSVEKEELRQAKEQADETNAIITAIIEGTVDSIWAFEK
jgi:ligand-binding sensor protein